MINSFYHLTLKVLSNHILGVCKAQDSAIYMPHRYDHCYIRLLNTLTISG